MSGDTAITLSVVLLTGGESCRMGRDKATIQFEGQPLWKRQLELLRCLDPQHLFVSARTRPEWLPDDVELVLDDSPLRGPLSGVAKGLSSMRTTHLVALAVDMPFMTAAELEQLVKMATEDCGVVPVIGERAEPLAAIYPARAAADFQKALGGDDFSLQRLVQTLVTANKLKLWPIADTQARLYRNVNTPGEFPEFAA